MRWPLPNRRATDEAQGESVMASNPAKGRIGLKIFEKTKDNNDAVIDIVFVHGLTGNRETTWTHKASGICWPEHLLPESLPKARIMTFGYDADVVNILGPVSMNRVRNYAGNLASALANRRDLTETNDRPIIFVAHSLGGIVCEDALLVSKNSAEPHIQQILECTRGIAFLGTPHHGADLAKWVVTLTHFTNLIGSTNKDIAGVLKPDSEALARIQSEFHSMVRARQDKELPSIKITCFFEELAVSSVGVIVPMHSAVLPGYTSIGIHANHTEMARFESTDTDGYEAILGELSRWTRAAEKEKETAASAAQPTLVEEARQKWAGSQGGVYQSSTFGGVNNTMGGMVFQGNLSSGGGTINIG